MINEMLLTYQSRLMLNQKQEEILQECACLLSQVERCLFAEVCKGKSSASCKNTFLRQFGITARQFNACRLSVETKISACQASQELAITNLKSQIKTFDQKIKVLERKPSKHFVLHQKKRRRDILLSRLSSLEKDQKEKKVRLCFGGKKLFKAQFQLEENGFTSHSEWKKAWEEKRNGEFFILGSKDETAGNQTCVAYLQSDGKLTLRLRLPKMLEEKYGKYLGIKDVAFAYGHESIIRALSSQAISYRFKKDDKSWRIFVSTACKKKEPISKEGIGVIGIDLNSDHIACTETDRFGNIVDTKIIPWVSYGKTKGQLKALTKDVCKEIVEKAKKVKKPLVIEKLDFQKKKLALKEESSRYFARLLSCFAYSLFFSLLTTRAFKDGIHIHEINPAYTSLIGRVKFAKRYGLTIHLAAALCIARRYLMFSESPTQAIGVIPDGKEGHVAFDLPARNRTKHVWHFWAQVNKKIKMVLAAHFRAMYHRSLRPLKAAL